jgi:hypothetical protein
MGLFGIGIITWALVLITFAMFFGIHPVATALRIT